MKNSKVAVLLPCYNEEKTIGKVVRDFRAVLPEADIYVYDNNSTDRTAELAAEAGAIVRRERTQGKGNVIRRMFREVEATSWPTVTTPTQRTMRHRWWPPFLRSRPTWS